jgi:hypothetical protein
MKLIEMKNLENRKKNCVILINLVCASASRSITYKLKRHRDASLRKTVRSKDNFNL